MKQQLQIIRITMRSETRRLGPGALDDMRMRAFAILDHVEAEANEDPALLAEVAAVREEIS